MNLFIGNLLKKIYNKFYDRSYFSQKVSYSQCGEDLIVDFLLTWILNIKVPTFMDIGAHHPHNFNNTYIFYKRGCRGVNIEPDPVLFDFIKKMRPEDININKGVGFKTGNETADFYLMSSKALNTFSREEAERISKNGNIQINEVKQIELININELMNRYFDKIELDFLSLDVEGLDFDILKSIDFGKYAPKVICVETIEFSEHRTILKQQATIDFLIAKGYFCYADTSINSIFVKQSLF
ncbi:MAG: SAM-dependent methyltransferase [Ferruginibacter sp.]|uniref:FkbM family methyltransferase n=1 Tax=Ferruginibacter sp. TaxID=1940288 RepID=UPI0026587AEA|nr:FkbM family methyltransferase [Ferruginibacter sp.]MDB5280359.1 SAM-dependent methyltransferase [Ferruginibacter sp.]